MKIRIINYQAAHNITVSHTVTRLKVVVVLGGGGGGVGGEQDPFHQANCLFVRESKLS